MVRLWLVLGLFAAVFYVFSVVSVALADRLSTRGLPKAAWVLVVIFFPFVGGALWFGLGRRPIPGGSGQSGDGGSGGGGGGGGWPRPGGPGSGGRGRQATRRTGPIAPDDDPEFLAQLKRRQQHHDGDPDA